MEKNRMLWIDAAKAFAIILVVVGHELDGLKDAKIWSDPTSFDLLFNSIYLFHMPLFFFLSGFLFQGDRRTWPEFMGRLGTTIVLPYFLWVFILITMKLLAAGDVNKEITSWAYIESFYSPGAVFWFFYALFFMQIFAKYVLQRLNLAWLVIMAAFAFELKFFCDLESIAGIAVMLICEFFIYFVLGRLVADKGWLQATKPAVWSLAAFGVFAVLLAVFQTSGFIYNTLPGRLAAIPLVGLLILGFRWADGWAVMRSHAVTFLGPKTMPIYVMHVLFTAGSRVFLNKLGIHDLTTHMVVGVVLGVGAPLVAYEVFKRLRLLPWLGLGGSFRRKAA